LQHLLEWVVYILTRLCAVATCQASIAQIRCSWTVATRQVGLYIISELECFAYWILLLIDDGVFISIVWSGYLGTRSRLLSGLVTGPCLVTYTAGVCTLHRFVGQPLMSLLSLELPTGLSAVSLRDLYHILIDFAPFLPVTYEGHHQVEKLCQF